MTQDAYVHRSLEGGAGAILLFAFHGTGGDETQMPPMAREIIPSATVVAPRGDVSENGAARFFRRTAEGVYDMDDLARATVRMTGFVQAHVRARQPAAVFGLGYSNGANILAATLFAQPALFDAVVLMHPLIPFEPVVEAGLRGCRVMITAGKRDPICPPDLTIRLETHLRRLGAETIVDWHDGGHELRPSEIEAARRFLRPVGA